MSHLIYKVASVRVQARGGLCAAKIAGIVTAESAREIIAGSASWAGKRSPSAKVIDYRGAMLAIKPDSLMAAAKKAQLEEDAPAALVVTADQLGVFRDYCDLAAQAGKVKAAFLCPVRAHEWAARQALVWEHWQLVARALRSSP